MLLLFALKHFVKIIITAVITHITQRKDGPSKCHIGIHVVLTILILNIIIISGYSALMWSSCEGDLDVTRFLWESKADVAARNS